MLATYRECLKNHAAAVGGHALDGCGEFMPSLNAIPTDPSSLNCAACGCHRNFHRREPDDSTAYVRDNRRRHSYRVFPSMPLPARSPSSSPSVAASPSSPNPLPISHIPPPYHLSAPHGHNHMTLLALGTGFSGTTPEERSPDFGRPANEIAKVEKPKEGVMKTKRKRTKFSRDQKEKMYLFSEKIGWRIHKSDERIVEEFCNEIGIGKRVLKIWMHNNKFGGFKSSQSCCNGGNESTESM